MTSIPQLYPVINGVDQKAILAKVENRIRQLQQQKFNPPPVAPVPVLYQQLPSVDYYYQKFYNTASNSKWLNTSLHFNPWSAQSWVPMSQQNAQPDQGNILSPADTAESLYPTIQMPESTHVITAEEFQKLRRHNSIESALEQLIQVATCLDHKNPGVLPKNIARACFICTNSYTKKSLKLGVGPVNDSITVAANHKYMGYKVYFIHNPKSTTFLSFLRAFLERTTEYFTFYYTGHGANGKNYNGTEKSGFDQYLVFDDDHVKDDTLATYLRDYATGAPKTLLLVDCCHSGTIWDIPEDPIEAMKFPGNIVSISSTDDSQTAKQGTIENNSQGMFTFFFWRAFKEHPTYNFKQIKEVVDKEIKKYNQEMILHSTRRPLLEISFFPPH